MFCKLCENCGTIRHEKECRSCGYREIKEFISLGDYFRCYTTNHKHPAFNRDFRDVPGYMQEVTGDILENAGTLVKTINSLFTQLEELTGSEYKLSLTSGFRPPSYAAELGLSTRSYHCTGLAVDIADIGNTKYDTIVNIAKAYTPEDLLTKLGLWVENKSATRTWLHLDLGQRRGRPVRVFLP